MFGILNLMKPVGPTSRDCVNEFQRIVKPFKIGHAGTLDPIADGVLLLLIGQAVRLTDAIHTLPKTYVGTFQLGVHSDSMDIESPLIPIPDAPIIKREQIEAVLDRFRGKIQQTPPKFSAIWVDGKRAHELARSGAEFDIPKREVWIESLEIVAFDYPVMKLRISCSTGTYVRSIGRDIALALGTDAAMTHLTRTAIGPFSIADSVSIESLTTRQSIESRLVNPTVGLAHWPQALPQEETITKLEQGKSIDFSELHLASSETDFAAVTDSHGRLRALVKRIEGPKWRADKCFLPSQCHPTES